MSDDLDFLPFRNVVFHDAGDHGLAMRLETQESTDGRVFVFGCSLSAWKLCTNMTADDVTATLKLALEASGCNRANVVHKPKLLSDNGSSISPAIWLNGSRTTVWITFGAHRITRKPRARSSAGIKR